MDVHQSQSPQRKGPPREEWATHKSTIIQLYKRHTMKEVQQIMSQRHSFHASKRMYDRKFKRWGVGKNMSTAQKAEIVETLRSTGEWADTASPSLKRPPDMDLCDYNKIVKYIKSSSPAAPLRGQFDQHQTVPSSSHLAHSHPRSHASNGSWKVLSAHSDSDNVIRSPVPLLKSFGERSHPSTEWSQLSASEAGLLSAADDEDIDGNRYSHDEDDEEAEAIQVGRSPGNVISFPIRSDSSIFNLSLITYTMQTFFSSTPPHMTPATSTSNPATPALVPDFWTEFKHGIYLHKIQSWDLAWPTLNRAASLAKKACKNASTFNATFLLQLFSTLSPINVNTQDCPRLRTYTLQYLSYLAQETLKAPHPIAIICHELQKDTSNDREVSERALLYLRDVTSSQSQSGDAALDDIAFQSERSLITLLRRASDLGAARDRARSLLHRSRQQLAITEVHEDREVPRTHIRVKQARTAATELAHIYMDQTENLDEAIGLCFYVLTGRVQNPLGPDHWMTVANRIIQDSKSVYAMEDLAKIYGGLRADSARAVEWLERALEMALEVFGGPEEDVATAHVLEKLNMLRQVGQGLLAGGGGCGELQV